MSRGAAGHRRELLLLRAERSVLSLSQFPAAHIHGPVTASVGFGLENTEVKQRGVAAFYLDQGTPDGVRDGFTGFMSCTLEWDSRDDETIPSRGVFHEWSYESARNSLVGLFFKEINFQRYTFTDMRYAVSMIRLLTALSLKCWPARYRCMRMEKLVVAGG